MTCAIKTHECIIDNGKYYISGTIYRGDLCSEDIVIKVEWYNGNKLIHTSWGYVYDVEKGETKQFKAPEEGWAGRPTRYYVLCHGN